jgi:transposase
VIPRQWKVIQTVREKFSCRDCETITQPPAPFHVTPRGFAGPQLLAMILFEKFGQHQPLNRQSERYRREGIDLSLSTLADLVGACTTALRPLHALIERHVLAAERLHGDDTTVPILAKGKTIKGHIWTYVRDDRPFGGRAPPAALYYASRDRRHEHPARHLHRFNGILQADAYSGYNELYDPSRAPGPITSALCWAHARRQFFELADIAANARRGKNAAAISPIALEAVKRIDMLFDIERGINGQSAEQRLRMRKELSAPLIVVLEAWLREQRSRLSNASSVAGPIDYMLRRWDRFTRFLDDGRICLTNNAAERALRGFALGRKSWLFAGSERGADRAAVMATLITTALCRARHNAVYAECRTMPSGTVFPNKSSESASNQLGIVRPVPPHSIVEEEDVNCRRILEQERLFRRHADLPLRPRRTEKVAFGKLNLYERKKPAGLRCYAPARQAVDGKTMPNSTRTKRRRDGCVSNHSA